jgi:hypothetical protein
MEAEKLPPGLAPPGVIIPAGPFGSGKTEIALNLAERWAGEGPTYLADLDVVTPYFRSRDAGASLRAAGVRLVSPEGEAGVYDTPVLPREMGRALADRESSLVIDVGGRPHGAGVLVHWRQELRAREARLVLVVNPLRPEEASPAEAAELARTIAESVGLRLSGIIANGNLGPQTTRAHVAAGVRQARELERLLGAPILAVGVASARGDETEAAEGLPLLELKLHLRPPWLGGS